MDAADGVTGSEHQEAAAGVTENVPLLLGWKGATRRGEGAGTGKWLKDRLGQRGCSLGAGPRTGAGRGSEFQTHWGTGLGHPGCELWGLWPERELGGRGPRRTSAVGNGTPQGGLTPGRQRSRDQACRFVLAHRGQSTTHTAQPGAAVVEGHATARP